MINKSPIYQQLNIALKELICNETYKTGDKFLTERAICLEYEVSRATANKALSSLVSEGLLEFKKGVGTFVRSKPDKVGKFLLENTNDLTEKQIAFQTLKNSDLSDEFIQNTGLDPHDLIHCQKKILCTDQIPIIYREIYIPAKHSSQEPVSDHFDSIVKNLPIQSWEEEVICQILTEEEAEHLQSSPGSAAYEIRSLRFNSENELLCIVKSLVKKENLKIRSRKNREQSEQLNIQLII